jgi:hypothetical protein
MAWELIKLNENKVCCTESTSYPPYIKAIECDCEEEE